VVGTIINPEGTDYKTIVIPNADVSQEYVLVVKGIASGTMEIKIQVPDANTKLKRYVEYTDVPVSATTTVRVELKPEIILPRVTVQGNSVRDTITRLEIDSDGDGKFELESTPRVEVTRDKLKKACAELNIEDEALSALS